MEKFIPNRLALITLISIKYFPIMSIPTKNSFLFLNYGPIASQINLSDLVKNLKIPIKKVAIELNNEIVDKKKINKINLKNNDKIEIVHFIGGG